MHDTSKTKAQLIDELETLRERVAALEASQATATDVEGHPTEEIMLKVAEEMADGLIVMDLDGRYVFINRAGEKLFGIKKANFIGKTCLDIAGAADRAEFLQIECDKPQSARKAVIADGASDFQHGGNS